MARLLNGDTIEPADFGRELLALRTERGLTMRQLVDLADGEIDRGSISRYERGVRTPGGSTLPVLARVYGVRFVADADGLRIERL